MHADPRPSLKDHRDVGYSLRQNRPLLAVLTIAPVVAVLSIVLATGLR